ncbi:MAG: VOC family protein [Myxococcota bacterium]
MDAALSPRLICHRAADAIAFYQRVFGAEELERFATPEGLIVHAGLSIRGSVFSLADADEPHNRSPTHLGGTPVLFTLRCDDPDAIAREAVAAGATVVIPVEDRFYGFREGRIRDPFGHLWILSKPIRTMTPEEIQKGVDEYPS